MSARSMLVSLDRDRQNLARAAALAITMGLTSVALSQQVAAQAYAPDSHEEHAALHAQRSNKVFYTKKFDLSGLPHYKPEQQASGTLRLWGNNYIGDSPLGEWWAEAFKKYQPGVEIGYNLPSAAIATASLYLDLADIGINHEPTFYDYLSFVRMKGFTPTGFSVVTGSYDCAGWQNTMVIAVRKDNPLSKLTMEQLDGIFGSTRDGGWIGQVWHPEFARGPEKDIRTWGQLGLTGEWANKRINVYGYTPRYATALEFSNKVLGGSDKWNGDLHAFGNWRRPDNTIYGQAEQITDHLLKDPDGIAIIRYTPQFPKDLKVLALAPKAGATYVEYTLDSVQNRTYPLWGDQSFWVAAKPGTKMDPKIKEFVRFVLSQEGQELVQRDGKYLPLTKEVVEEELKKLESM